MRVLPQLAPFALVVLALGALAVPASEENVARAESRPFLGIAGGTVLDVPPRITVERREAGAWAGRAFDANGERDLRIVLLPSGVPVSVDDEVPRDGWIDFQFRAGAGETAVAALDKAGHVARASLGARGP